MKVFGQYILPSFRIELESLQSAVTSYHEVNIVFQMGCYNFCQFALTTAVKVSEYKTGHAHINQH